MSCLWKSQSSASCACAYRLQGPMVEILNQLPHLGSATLVLRSEGLSLAKTTRFGLSIAYGKKDWTLLHDQISGLQTDTSVPQEFHLLTDLSDPRPLLLLGKPNSTAELSIRLDSQSWNSPKMKELIHHFNGASLHCLESRRLGAGAWLDDWCPQFPSHGELARNACAALADFAEIEVEIRTSAHSNIVNFRPAFFDHDGPILKIADHNCHHVVYADTSASGFSLTPRPGCSTRIRLAMAS